MGVGARYARCSLRVEADRRVVEDQVRLFGRCGGVLVRRVAIIIVSFGSRALKRGPCLVRRWPGIDTPCGVVSHFAALWSLECLEAESRVKFQEADELSR